MLYKLLALRDIKANAFLPPICVPNINVFLRDLGAAVNDANPKEAWQKYPEDFELWVIGEYDAEDGHLNGWGFDGTHQDEDGQRKQLLVLSTLKVVSQ